MLFKYFLQLVLLLLTLCLGQSEPELSYISLPQVKSVGDIVDLECVLHSVNASEYSISWLKEMKDSVNLYKLLSRDSRTIPDDRYTVAYIPIVDAQDAGLFRFQIKNLRESDSGTYICNVHLSATTRLEGRITLTVEPVINDAEQSPAVEQEVDTNTIEIKTISTITPADHQ